MNRGNWDEPVTFETMKLGHYRVDSSADEAAHVIVTQWPVRTGWAWRRAQAVSLKVQEGKNEPAAAREAFLKAAKEAGVVIKP